MLRHSDRLFHDVTPAKAGAHPETSWQSCEPPRLDPGLRRDDTGFVESEVTQVGEH
jgi:hypothetical protein